MKWCKIAADFDANPKAFNAGFFGRSLFLFLVRLNTRIRGDGIIPEQYMDLDYLTQQWAPPGGREQVVDALVDATTAELLERNDDGSYALVGWSREEWGAPLTGAERAARHKLKKKSGVDAQPMTAEPGDPPEVNLGSDPHKGNLERKSNGRVTPSPKSNKRRQKRGEERRIEEKRVEEKTNPRAGARVSEDNPAKRKRTLEECEAIYKAYPRKIGKAKGLAALGRIAMDDETYNKILFTVNAMKTLWKDVPGSEMRFCPHFSTWVNGRRWDDDAISAPSNCGVPNPDDVTADQIDQMAQEQRRRAK